VVRRLIRLRDVHAIARFSTAIVIALGSVLLIAGCGPVPETSWSPDSTSVAYLDNGALRLLDLRTKQSKPVDTGPGRVVSPSWSPDGATIAFYSVVEGKAADVSLRAVTVSTGQVRTLASGIWPLPTEPPSEPATTGQSPEKALEEAQGEALVVLVLYGTIAWSPDGARLACMAASADRGAILLVDGATGAARRIVEDTNAVGMAAWSPDGARLAYVRGAGPPVEEESQSDQPPGVNTICVYDFATGAREQVCEVPDDVAPVPGTRLEWSADSARLGFIAQDKHNEERGIGCTLMAQPGAAARDEMLGITPIAAWAPGLAGLVFLEQREGDQWVLIYRGLRPRTRQVLGTLPLQTNDQEDWFSLPQFSHDGRKVALRVGKDPFPVSAEVFEVK
jgi:dipeptidyl aminopeptidase/acylaminoacyl peptidase